MYAVMDHRLADREYLAGEYSIADIACYPWVVPYERQGQKIDEFPNLQRWFRAIGGRETVIRTSQPRAFRNRNRRSVEKPSSRPFKSAETLG